MVRGSTVFRIEFEAVVRHETTLFLRKVPWRHLLHENLTGLEKMLHHLWGHGFHAYRLSHSVGGRAFQEAADDVDVNGRRIMASGYWSVNS